MNALTQLNVLKAAPASPRAHFRDYAARLSDLMAEFDWEPVEELAFDLAACIRSRRQLFIAGNGGSAGNATHLANDFLYGVSKQAGYGLRVHSLAANPAVLTCLANDEGYDRVFEIQLAELAQKGDLLLVFSGSGNSPNILKVLEQARLMGVKSYAVLGYDGGRAKAMADVAIHSPRDDMQLAEDMQMVLGHMLMQWLWLNRYAIRGQSAPEAVAELDAVSRQA